MLKAQLPATPLSALEFGCTGEFQDFLDGQGGRVWKPVSDNTGRPVFLLPNFYCELLPPNSGRVEVFRPDGEFLTNGLYRTCSANGNRYHHDVTVISGSVVVRLVRTDGIVDCLRVPNVNERFD